MISDSGLGIRYEPSKSRIPNPQSRELTDAHRHEAARAGREHRRWRCSARDGEAGRRDQERPARPRARDRQSHNRSAVLGDRRGQGSQNQARREGEGRADDLLVDEERAQHRRRRKRNLQIRDRRRPRRLRRRRTGKRLRRPKELRRQQEATAAGKGGAESRGAQSGRAESRGTKGGRAEAGEAQGGSRRDEAVQAGRRAGHAEAGRAGEGGRGCRCFHSGRAFGAPSGARARREYPGHSRLRSGRTHLDGRCHRVCAAAAVWRRCGAFSGVGWRGAARLQQMGSGRAQGDERRSPHDRAPADTGVEHRAARVPARSRGHYGRRDAAQAAVEEIRSRGKGADHHHGVPDEDARRGPEEIPDR